MGLNAGDWFAARYRIRGLLGRGGLGTTYRAVDEVTDIEVALKVTEASAAHVDTLRREFIALRGLVHPRLANVLDFGVARQHGESARAYFAARLVEGISLEARATEAGDARKRWDDLTLALVDALNALSFLHARGILHGDFHPKNIVIDAQGRGTLIDLGAARLFGMSDDGPLAGTKGYIAPERGRGPVGPAADIFAFGQCIRALAHRAGEPPPPSLATLARRASSRLVAERPTLAAIVEALGGTQAIPDAGSLVRSAFVGRDEEVRRFEVFLQGRLRGDADACTLVIEGPSGSGKTRLLTELKWRAQLACTVIEASAARPGAIASMVGRAGALHASGASAPPHHLGDLSDIIDTLSRHREPILFFLDDADTLSERDQEHLTALIRWLDPKKRLGLVLVSPRAAGDGSTKLSLAPLDRAAIQQWIGAAIPTLDVEDVVRATFGIPADVVALASAHAGGLVGPTETPTWWQRAADHLRTDERSVLAAFVVSRRPLSRDTFRAHDGTILDALVQAGWLLEQESVVRLARTADRRRWLAHLSGEEQAEARRLLIESTAEDSATDVAQILDHLLTLGRDEEARAMALRHFARIEADPAPFRDVFTDHQVRDADLAVAAATAFEKGGRPRRAIDCVARALRRRPPEPQRGTLRAIAGRAYTRLGDRRGVRLLERAGAPLAMDLGIAYVRQAAYAKAKDVSLAALRGDTLASFEVAELTSTLAIACSYLGHHDEARSAIARVSQIDDSNWPARRRFRIQGAKALVAYRDNRLDEARGAYVAAFELARKNGLDDLTTSAALNTGVVAHQAGDWGEAQRAYEQGLRMATALDLRVQEVTLGFNLAKLWADIGETERARVTAERARERARTQDMPFFVASIDSVLAELAVSEGRMDQATRLFDDAQRCFEAMGAEREALEVQLASLENREATADVTELAKRVARLDSDDLRAKLEAILGEDRLAASDARAAIGHFKAALAAAERGTQIPLVALTHARLSRAYDAIDASVLADEQRSLARGAWERIMASLDAAVRALFRKHPARRALFEVRTAATSRRDGDEVSRLRKVLDLYRRLNSAATVQDVLDATMDAAIELTRAERGFLILCEKDAGARASSGLRVRAARNMDRETLGNAPSKFSRNIAARVISGGEALLSTNAEGDPRLTGMRSVHALRLKSILSVPVRAGSTILGAIYLDNRLLASGFTDQDVELLLTLADQAALALSRARLTDELAQKTRELEADKQEIERLVRLQAAEIARLSAPREPPSSLRTARSHAFSGIVGTSAAMDRVLDVLDRVIDVEVSVLLRGESGTGKEILARAIHEESPRNRGPFVAVNCGALPDALLEAELFGYVRGAFTGAVADKVGLFSAAHGGTLFLDELGEMPLALQVKLLRVLQEREVRPLGALQSVPIDVRILCATNRKLREEVAAGRFREDLYYRVAVVDIELPPLRERPEDIPLLARTIMARLAAQSGREPLTLDGTALRALVEHSWPGNVRQLENVITRAFLLGDGETLRARDLGLGPSELEKPPRGFRADEAAKMLAALESLGWNVSEAARSLGIPRASFYRKLRRYRLRRE